MNPTGSVYDDPRLQTARTNYETASRAATNADAQTTSLPDLLKTALTQKFQSNNPLIQGRERALTDYMKGVTEAPLSVTAESAGGNAPVIYNPQQQANLIQARRATTLAPLTTANFLLDTAQGGIGDVIDATSRASQAETKRLYGEAELAQNNYKNVLEELSARAEEAYKRASLAGGGTSTEREASKATAAMQRDVARGVTFSELYTRYAADLPEYAIREAYNAGPMAKRYGPAKESSADLQAGLSQIKKSKPLDKETSDAQASITKQLDTLSSAYGKIGVTDKILSLIPGSSRVNVNLSNYNTARNLIATDLAKLRQKGVLSNQDINQAMSLFPPAASSTDVARANIQQVKDYINTRIAINSGGDVSSTQEPDWNTILNGVGL